jgi:sec-independent protein translocase protein TatA
MLGGIGMPELLVVLVIILIVFGAGKLPEIGAGMGKAIKNFKKATNDQEDPAISKQSADRLDDKTQGIKS